MSTAWFRFAFACEFLLAVVAVFTMWGQVGGQGHLDLMPWYWKFLLGCGLSAAVVGLTAVLVREDHTRSRRSVSWGLAVLALMAAMAAVTFYYHLHEVDDSDEEGTTAVAAILADC